jgi:hypothetical protein
VMQHDAAHLLLLRFDGLGGVDYVKAHLLIMASYSARIRP